MTFILCFDYVTENVSQIEMVTTLNGVNGPSALQLVVVDLVRTPEPVPTLPLRITGKHARNKISDQLRNQERVTSRTVVSDLVQPLK